MNTTSPTVHHIAGNADVVALNLSFYSLCRLADTVRRVDPRHGMDSALQFGDWKGELTLDALGNFVSFV